jgi:hypothetical protein
VSRRAAGPASGRVPPGGADASQPHRPVRLRVRPRRHGQHLLHRRAQDGTSTDERIGESQGEGLRPRDVPSGSALQVGAEDPHDRRQPEHARKEVASTPSAPWPVSRYGSGSRCTTRRSTGAGSTQRRSKRAEYPASASAAAASVTSTRSSSRSPPGALGLIERPARSAGASPSRTPAAFSATAESLPDGQSTSTLRASGDERLRRIFPYSSPNTPRRGS